MMANNNSISRAGNVFHGRTAPEQGNLVGYGAIIDALKLPVPIPFQLALISKKRRQYTKEAGEMPSVRQAASPSAKKNCSGYNRSLLMTIVF
jgi:hypothetical protein